MNEYETGLGHAAIFGIGVITAFVVLTLLSIDAYGDMISLISLIVASVSLGLSFHFWRRSFRPIITAMVKTVESGNINTMFNLEIANTGTIPAKNIRLNVNIEDIENAFGEDASEENKRRWLSCFEPENNILILHNNSTTKCSFGYCSSSKIPKGFWKYESVFPITIEYQGWFGKNYKTEQNIQIKNTESFTDCNWKQKQ